MTAIRFEVPARNSQATENVKLEDQDGTMHDQMRISNITIHDVAAAKEGDWQHDVFISYRRADATQAARALRDRLLRYKLPPAFQFESARKLSVFVDTVYERADTDFFEDSIKPSLRGSKYLLVIVTREAFNQGANAASWLAREIEYFLTLPQGQNILIALVDGQFGSPLPAGLEKRFPNIEILDFRDLHGRSVWPFSNKRVDTEVLKLIATLHGIPHHRMPDLHCEEQLRIASRSRRVALGSIVLSATLGALAVFAFVQKREARERQREAEVQTARVYLGEARRLSQSQDTVDAAIHALAISLQDGLPRNTPGLNTLIAEVLEQPASVPLSAMRHGGDIRGVRFSRDGTMLATASKDNTARVWSVQTGGPLTEPLRHGGWANSPDFNPDGSLLLTASNDGKARIWNTHTGDLKHQLDHGAQDVWSAKFSPGGDRVVGVARFRAQVWDVATGEKHLPEFMQWGIAGDAMFSPDGTRVLTWSPINGTSANVWILDSPGLPANELEQRVQSDVKVDEAKSIRLAEFSPDGRRFLTSAGNVVHVWDTMSGDPVGKPMIHQSTISAAAFSGDGGVIATADETGVVRTWNSWSGAQFGAPMENRGSVSKVAFVDAQHLLVVTTYAAHIWDIGSENSTATLYETGSVIWAADLSKDGRLLALGGSDQAARVLQTNTQGTQSAQLKHAEEIESVALSPDGMRVVTASRDKTARVWDARTGKKLSPALRLLGSSQGAVFSPGGTLIATTDFKGVVALWDAQTYRHLRSFEHGGVAWGVSFSEDERLVAVATGTGAWIHRVVDGSLVAGPFRDEDAKDRGDEDVYSAELSRDGSHLVTAFSKGARLWRVGDGNPVGQPILPGIRVKRVSFDSSGSRFITASADGTARVWDVEMSSPTGVVLTHESEINDAAFSPDGKTIATGSDDHSARLWDAKTGKLLVPSLQHTASVDSVGFSGDGHRVITGTSDHMARVWDVATGQPISRWLPHGNSVVKAVLNNDGTLAVTASYDGIARVWAITDYISESDRLAPVLEALYDCGDTPSGIANCTANSRDNLASLVDTIENLEVRGRVRYHLLGQPGSHPLLHGTPYSGNLQMLRRFLAVDHDALEFWWQATGSVDLAAALLLAEVSNPPCGKSEGIASRLAQLQNQIISVTGKDDLALVQVYLLQCGFVGIGSSLQLLDSQHMDVQIAIPPMAESDHSSKLSPSSALFDADIAYYLSSRVRPAWREIVLQLSRPQLSANYAKQAFEQLASLANSDPTAAYLVAKLFQSNLLGTPDTKLADALLNMAAEADFAPAQIEIARTTLRLPEPTEAARELVKNWTAAQCGAAYPPACAELGDLAFEDEDWDQARRWFEKALEVGSKNGEPERRLAMIYELGIEVPRSLRKSQELLVLAAEKGNQEAQLALALRLEQGLGVEKRPDDARGWYAAAARQGNVQAMYRLGQLAPQPLEAANWFWHAAVKGHIAAQYALADKILREGTLRKANLAMAKSILDRLIELGRDSASSKDDNTRQWIAGEARLLWAACKTSCTEHSAGGSIHGALPH